MWFNNVFCTIFGQQEIQMNKKYQTMGQNDFSRINSLLVLVFSLASLTIRKYIISPA